MKEQILAALKTKFPGVNANILSRIAEKLSKTVTNEEQVTTAVAGVAREMIETIESYGDSRATEATQTATQNYELKYGLKDGKPVSGGVPNGQNGSETAHETTQSAGVIKSVPDWAKELIESNKKLSERLNKMDGEHTTATRKQQLSAVYKKLPDNLRKPYERIPVGTLSDEEFAELVDEVATEVEGLVKTLGAKGAVFGRPSEHNGGVKKEELTKDQMIAITKREGGQEENSQYF